MTSIKAYNVDTFDFEYVKQNNSGLLISGGGGGGGGDASSANQDIQILEAQATNSKLTTINSNLGIIRSDLHASGIVQEAIYQKLDTKLINCNTSNISGHVTIDSTDPIQVVSLAKVYGTLNNTFLTTDGDQALRVNVINQSSTAGLALESTLGQVKTAVEKNKYSGDLLLTAEKPLIKTEPVVIVFDEEIGPQIWGDSTVPWYNPEDGLEGWGYNNTTQGGAQLYYYANTQLTADATEGNIELGSLSAGWYIGSQALLTDADNRFILAVYTKPTGSGDAQPWYKSRKSYQLNSSFPLSKNVDYLFYWGTDPVDLHPELQHVELALANTQGPCASSEIVQFLSVNVPSVVPQYKFQGRVKRAGYIRNGVAREVVFANSLKRDAEAHINQMQFDTVVNGINVPGIPGPLIITGNVAIKQAVFTPDELTSNLCLQVRDELVQREVYATNGVLSDVVSGNLQFHVAVDALNNDSVGIYGYSPVLSMPEAIYTVDNSMKVYIDNVPAVNIQAQYAGNNVSLLTDASQRLLVSSQIEGDVNIGNQITGFATETTLDAIKSKTDQLTFGTASALLVEGQFFQPNQPVSFETPQDVNLFASDFKLTSTQTGASQFSLDVNINNIEAIPVSIDQMAFTAENELMVYDGDTFQELQTLNGKVSKCDTDNVTVSGNVSVTNMISGFATETTLDAIKLKSDLLTFSSKDGLNALLVKVDNQLTTPFSVTETNPLTNYATETTSSAIQTQTDKLAFSTTELDGNALNTRLYGHDVANDMVRPLRLGESLGLTIENAPGTSLSVSGAFYQAIQPVSIADTVTVSVSGTVPISSGSPLETRCYASSNGTNWHHLSSDANGQLNVHSKLQDGAGNDLTSSLVNGSRSLDVSCKGNVAVNLATSASGSLTSTSVSGTDTYNALHVITKGTTTVSGTTKSQAQDTNNNQIANNVSVMGPVQIGNSADTQGYLWVSAIFSFSSVTAGGQVYLEVSHDGSFWARPSSASTFIMSSMATTTGSIILSTACPFRYARLFVDSGFNGSGCSAWIVMK